MIHLDWRKYLYISLENPLTTMNKLKGVFKPLTNYVKVSRKSWSPVMWCSKPAYIHIMSGDLGWKDKYGTPRYEWPPYIWIYLFGISMVIYWELPEHQRGKEDDYWEQALWYLYYASYNRKKKGYDELDINKAREKWPWKYSCPDPRAGQSCWSDEFLKK